MLVTRNKELSDSFSPETSCLKPSTMHYLLSNLPSALKTPDNVALLKNYFLIPQLSVRRFILGLFGRVTNDAGASCPIGDLAEAEFLLTHYAQLPAGDARDKMSALMRQVCIANRGTIGGRYDTHR